MAILEIIKYPDPRLNEQCAQVADFGITLHQLLDDMAGTMYRADGVGLAAPQVGVLTRATVIDVSENRDQVLELVNPIITARSGEVSSNEGCLSIPDYRDTVKRSTNISVTALDRNGREFKFEAADLLAICIQHEIDHLDGVLFVDRLSRLKREMFRRWFKKQAKIEK